MIRRPPRSTRTDTLFPYTTLFRSQVIIELNLAHNLNLEGLHDIYFPGERPNRGPIPLTKVDDRLGATSIPVDPAKIAAIVITNQPDSYSTVTPPDEETQAIANHLVEFFKSEVEAGRMAKNLGPMQVGIGNIANAVMCGLIDSPFEDLVMYSEVLQDCTFELIDAGKMTFASGDRKSDV